MFVEKDVLSFSWVSMWIEYLYLHMSSNYTTYVFQLDI